MLPLIIHNSGYEKKAGKVRRRPATVDKNFEILMTTFCQSRRLYIGRG
jgi:hypothetical protein